MHENYVGRWLYTTPDGKTAEFEVTDVVGTQAITNLPNQKQIDLFELDFNSITYLKLVSPIQAPEVSNNLKSIAGAYNGSVARKVAPQSNSESNEQEEDHSKPPEPDTDIFSGVPTSERVDEQRNDDAKVERIQPGSIRYVEPQDTESKVILSAIDLSREKNEVCDLEITIPLRIDFDLLRISQLSSTLGVDPNKAIALLLSKVTIDDEVIRKAISNAILPPDA